MSTGGGGSSCFCSSLTGSLSVPLILAQQMACTKICTLARVIVLEVYLDFQDLSSRPDRPRKNNSWGGTPQTPLFGFINKSEVAGNIKDRNFGIITTDHFPASPGSGRGRSIIYWYTIRGDDRFRRSPVYEYFGSKSMTHKSKMWAPPFYYVKG